MIKKFLRFLIELINPELERPKGCTCYEYRRISQYINYDCPLHGDWR